MIRRMFLLVGLIMMLSVTVANAAQIPLRGEFYLQNFINEFNSRNELKIQHIEDTNLQKGAVMHKCFLPGGKSWLNIISRENELLEMSMFVSDNNFGPPINSLHCALQLLGITTSRDEFYTTLADICDKDKIGVLTNDRGEKVWKYFVNSLEGERPSILITVYNVE